jgi:hypothetical protein
MSWCFSCCSRCLSVCLSIKDLARSTRCESRHHERVFLVLQPLPVCPSVRLSVCLSRCWGSCRHAQVPIVGEYTVCAFFSRSWQLREAALQRIERLLATAGAVPESSAREFYRTLSRLLGRALKDRVANIFLGSLRVRRTHVIVTRGACWMSQQDMPARNWPG